MEERQTDRCDFKIFFSPVFFFIKGYVFRFSKWREMNFWLFVKLIYLHLKIKTEVEK